MNDSNLTPFKYLLCAIENSSGGGRITSWELFGNWYCHEYSKMIPIRKLNVLESYILRVMNIFSHNVIRIGSIIELLLNLFWQVYVLRFWRKFTC